MGIIIHKDAINAEVAAALQKLCPFSAIDYSGGELSINAACKGCKICIKKGPAGALSWQDEQVTAAVDKSLWKGVAVFAQCQDGALHPVTPELIGKARELASVTGEEVIAVIIGCNNSKLVSELLSYGVDKVYSYDDAAFSDFTITPYANAFYDFIEKVKPGSILVGATNLGRSLAPKVAARCNTGLTADCTVLQMKENTDLVQIRPAFGGNIMAQIITPNARPQFCTVRYKIFTAPERVENPCGKVFDMEINSDMIKGKTQVISKLQKEKQIDISEAEVIVACGRGFKSEADIGLARELAELLGAQLACTRPLVEAGWLDPRRQIGLSGRTVKPKLIIALGISGSVQFAAGMNGSDRIVAINSDEQAAIFGIAHIGIVGDIYEILPALIEKIKEGRENV